MKNIIAASIIAFGMIASALIYLFTPKSGRYIFEHIDEDGRVGLSVFDTATAFYYQDVNFTNQKHPQRIVLKFPIIEGSYEKLFECESGDFKVEKSSIKISD